MNSTNQQEKLAVECVRAIGEGGLDHSFFSKDLTAWSAISGLMDRDVYLGKLKTVKDIFTEPLEMTIDVTTVQPGRVAIQCRSTGKLFTGDDYANNYHFLVEFDSHNKIRHVREYFDTSIAYKVLVPAMQKWLAQNDT